MSLRSFAKSLALLACSSALVFACSSKTDNTAVTGKKPTTKPTALPTTKPVTKPAPAPTGSTPAPTTSAAPSAEPPVPLDPSGESLLMSGSAIDTMVPCDVIKDKTGGCLPEPQSSYLYGCIGTTIKAFDCNIFNSSSTIAGCDASAKATCELYGLDNVAAEVLSAKEFGLKVPGITCQDSQNQKGLCYGPSIAFCAGKDLYVLNCPDGSACKAGADGALSCY